MPNDWIDGLKRIPLHGLFAAVGIGARFLPEQWGLVALCVFTLWRTIAEYGDYKGKRDTAGKAVIDFTSQVGSAVAGFFC